MTMGTKHHSVPHAAAELDTLQSRGTARFPPLCRSMLKNLPGNTQCADCAAPNPEWAVISYGSLICLQCSGRHRSYGVGVSVVRSVDLDHWTADQVLAMLEGGNAQLRTFFDRHNMSTMVSKRYHTKAAKFYRTHLTKHVDAVAAQGSYQGREACRQKYQKPASAQHCMESQERVSASQPQGIAVQ
jgi:hypothetical protein